MTYHGVTGPALQAIAPRLVSLSNATTNIAELLRGKVFGSRGVPASRTAGLLGCRVRPVLALQRISGYQLVGWEYTPQIVISVTILSIRRQKSASRL